MASHNASMELWLDCRDCTSLGPLPTECDRFLLREGASRMSERDLTWDEERDHLLDYGGRVVGGVYSGKAAEAQIRALAAVGSAEWIVLDASDGAVFVPAENLIAAGRQAGTRVAVIARNEQQVTGLAGALQSGVDALIIPATADRAEPEEDLWQAAAEAKRTRQHVTRTDVAENTPQEDSETTQYLSLVQVESVEPVLGLADRVCLDLVQLMNEGEGALVGSTAKALCLVQAETAHTGLVPPRPFRINAGPVHAYVALQGGRMKYLSEVAAGDQILVVDASTSVPGKPFNSRSIAVGRCKIEPRPVVCVRFSDGKRHGQIFLQQAETVRVPARLGSGRSSDCSPCSVTSLAPGDEICVLFADMGTHVGQRIASSVLEK